MKYTGVFDIDLMRVAFIFECIKKGLDPDKAHQYFDDRAKKEGWIK